MENKFCYWFVWVLLALVFSCSKLIAANHQSIGKPIIDHYPAHVYNANETNWSMLIADSGFLYAGNSQGVLEYDGNSWRLIDTPNNGMVTSIDKGQNSVIYVGANNSFGLLEKDAFGQMQYKDISSNSSIEDKEFGEVRTVFALDDAVYFAANKWLFRLNQDKSISSWFYTDNSFFTDVFQYQGVVYFTSQKNNHRLNNKDELELTTQFSDTDNKRIHVIETIKSNNLELLFSMNDIYIQKSNSFQIWDTQAAKDIHKSWMYNVIRYNEDFIAVATIRNGMYFISNDGSQVINISKEQGLPNEISLGFTPDNQDGVWVASMDNGISRIQSPLSIRLANDDLGLNRINKIIAYKAHLIGLSFTGLVDLTNPKEGKFKRLTLERDQLETIIDSGVNGLIVGGTFGIELLDLDFDDLSKSIQTPLIRGVLEIKEIIKSPNKNEFFIRLISGLGRLRYIDNTWKYEFLKDFKTEIISFAIDNHGLWLSMNTGEIKLLNTGTINSSTIEFTSYFIEKISDDTIENTSSQFPTKLFASTDGVLATYNNTVYAFDKIQNTFIKRKIFEFQTPISTVQQDKKGNYWISNKTDVINYDTNFNKRDLGLSKLLNPSSTNSLYFDDKAHLTYIMRNDGVAIINGSIKPFNSIQPLVKSIQSGKQLLTNSVNEIIKHHDVQFNISLPDFSRASIWQFKLCLTDEKCTNWSSNTSINYNNLAGGKYNATVFAKNNSGEHSSNRFSITIENYWYQNLWFKLIVVALIGLLVYLISKFSTYRLKKKNILLEELITNRTKTVEKQAQELHLLDQARLRFFSNVSHEFRTPLTLAIAPLESLISDKPDLPNDILHPVNTSLSNSKKMLSLVGQILDINRLESGQFPLRIARYDATGLINQLLLRFESWAQNNKQTIKIKDTYPQHFLYFDYEQIDRCLSNLLSNAIKYSGEGSKIILSIKQHKNTNENEHQNRIGLCVSDNGQGISKESELRIFDRYYQDKQADKISDAGTGIGLSLVKELMQLHHGSVELINHQGKGCEFILWLKQGKSHFDSAQMLDHAIEQTKATPQHVDLPLLENRNQSTAQNNDITTVLIVDDNLELCDFIASRIESYYHVIKAHNGQQGLDKAIEFLPDLVISDVMMPVMDGLELTQQLKANALTKTIPVILLTAKSSKRETVEGLQTGADDYLSKPFDSSELIIRVAGLINNRKLIRETHKFEFSDNISKQGADNFINNINQEIMHNLSDPTFSIESLSKNLALSQSSLQRKCKEKLEKTPIAYIRQIRMQQAMKMLNQKNHSVSEIAYATGFESLSYFSRTFKKHYGKSPSSI